MLWDWNGVAHEGAQERSGLLVLFWILDLVDRPVMEQFQSDLFAKYLVDWRERGSWLCDLCPRAHALRSKCAA